MGLSEWVFLHKLYKLKQGYFFALPSPSLAEGVWMGEVWHDGCFCVLFDKDGVWHGVVTVGVTQGWVLGPLQFLCSHLICLFPSVAGMLCAALSFVSSSPAVLSLCESLWTWKTLLWRDVSLEKTTASDMCHAHKACLLLWIVYRAPSAKVDYNFVDRRKWQRTGTCLCGHLGGAIVHLPSHSVKWYGLVWAKRVIRHSPTFSMSHHFSVSCIRPVADKCSMSAWNEGFDSWARTETEVIWLRQIWTSLMEADCWCLRWCWWNVLAPSLASSTVWCMQADAFTHTYTENTHLVSRSQSFD